MRILCAIISALATALMFLATNNPEEVISYIAGWAKIFGVDSIPEWLAAQSADNYVLALGVFLFVVGITGLAIQTARLHKHLPVRDIVSIAIDKHEKKNRYRISFLDTLEGFGSYTAAIPNLAKAITEYVDIYGAKSTGTETHKINKRQLQLKDPKPDGFDYIDRFDSEAKNIQRHSFRTTTTSIPEPELLWSNVSIKRKDIKTALSKLQTHDFD